MKRNKGLVLFLIMLALSAACNNPQKPAPEKPAPKPGSIKESSVSRGERLFTDNCTSCHAVFEKVTGPPLHGITQKRDTKWLIAFTRDSQKMIKDKDPQAMAVFKEYDGIVMNSFTFLSDSDILAIYQYVEGATQDPVPVAMP